MSVDAVMRGGQAFALKGCVDIVFSIISFNPSGNQSLWLHRKPDQVSSAQVAPVAARFQRYLLEMPARFSMQCEFDAVPAVEVEWSAVFASVGFAEFRFGDELAATALLLSGAHAASDRAAIDSIEAMLASNPRNTFSMAFSVIRKQGRPLAASFSMPPADSPEKLAAIRLANEALAEAFFELNRPQVVVPEEITHILKGV